MQRKTGPRSHQRRKNGKTFPTYRNTVTGKLVVREGGGAGGISSSWLFLASPLLFGRQRAETGSVLAAINLHFISQFFFLPPLQSVKNHGKLCCCTSEVKLVIEEERKQQQRAPKMNGFRKRLCVVLALPKTCFVSFSNHPKPVQFYCKSQTSLAFHALFSGH